MIDGIRKVLRLKADGVVLLIRRCRYWLAVAEVTFSRVELHAGLVGVDVHQTAAARFVAPRRACEALTTVAQNVVVVVPFG